MAMTFELAVECGPDESAAALLGRHFAGFHVDLRSGNGNLCSICRFATWQDEEGNWWCSILPSGASVTGGEEQTIKSTSDVFQLAQSLYEHLKSAPNFRYAVCGFEVTPFDTYSRLIQLKGAAHHPFNGLVLAQTIWEEIGRPVGYEVFSKVAYWVPLRPSDL